METILDQECWKGVIFRTRGLNIKFELKKEDECYVAYFDGSKTYSYEANWIHQWNGFHEYVSLLLALTGVSYVGITKIDATHVTVNLGSLFDMIKNVPQCNPS